MEGTTDQQQFPNVMGQIDTNADEYEKVKVHYVCGGK